jgi:phosphoglycolate phosphatase-like HAD superfamily hydrolase
MNIFCDLDGPILDVSERYFRVHQDIVEQCGGRRMDKATYWVLKRNRQPLPVLLAMTGNCTTEETYRKHWFHKIELLEYLRYDTVIQGAREQLERLRQRHTLILVTLRQRRDHLGIQLEQLSLGPCFATVLSASPTADEGSKTKQHLIAESGFLSGDALIIGDTEIDIRAGKELGLTTVAVSSGVRSRERLAEEGPDFIIGDINAFAQMMRARLKS